MKSFSTIQAKRRQQKMSPVSRHKRNYSINFSIERLLFIWRSATVRGINVNMNRWIDLRFVVVQIVLLTIKTKQRTVVLVARMSDGHIITVKRVPFEWSFGLRLLYGCRTQFHSQVRDVNFTNKNPMAIYDVHVKSTVNGPSWRQCGACVNLLGWSWHHYTRTHTHIQ